MIYIMSDVHGDYQSFYKMLVKINFSFSDNLYILGDVVDKGDENLCLLNFIRGSENMILIKGNHEYLFERYLQGIISAELWDACGTGCLAFLKSLPIYKILTVEGEKYFLTHSGYNADYEVPDPATGLIDIKESVERAASADQERYLFSNDIHYLPAASRFDKKIIVGHYPVMFLPEHGKASIYHGEKYIDIDTGNERRNEGGRLACLRVDDGREFYV